MKDTVITALEQAEKQKAKTNLEGWKTHDIYGLSSDRIKYLMNNLVATIPKAVYLELGVFRGATIIPAAYGNKGAKLYGVDDFHFNPLESPSIKSPAKDNIKHWPNVRSACMQNIVNLCPDKNIILLEKNFFTIKTTDILGLVNILFIDTYVHATEEDIIKIFDYYKPFMDKKCVVVVGSFSQRDIENGTNKAIAKHNFKIEYATIKKSSNTSDSYGWWAGLGIFILEKVDA